LDLARRAAEITRSSPADILDLLAAAYAANGRFEQAISIAKKVVQASSGGNESGSTKEVLMRLDLYKKNLRYIAKTK